MRELRTCDFCGTDAVGVFEVLPPELTPADDQRRVVLCDHCEETLNEVIAPLLTRLGVDAEVEIPDDAPAETGASATTTGGSASAGSAASVDVKSVDPAPTPAEPADHDSPDADTDAADPLDADSTQGDDAGGDEDVETAVAAEAEGEQEADAEEEEREAESEKGEAEADEEAESTSDDADDSDDRPSEPPKFRKVIRILQNREFPVERASAEALASNAYDLDDGQVAEIFDYAVERGLLVDDGGTLRKP